MRNTTCGVLAASLLAASPAIAEDGGFCARLATQLDMKEVPARKGLGVETEWKGELFNLAQKLLVGGTSMISFSVEPGMTGDMASDYARASKACRQEGKNIVCRPEAPDTITGALVNATGSEAVREGETPVLETPKKALLCRD